MKVSQIKEENREQNANRKAQKKEKKNRNRFGISCSQ